MKKNSPRSASSLTEAMFASGLIKPPKVVEMADQEIKPKKPNTNRGPSFVDTGTRASSQIKPSNIEDIIVDRQVTVPLPKLRQEPPISKIRPSIMDPQSYSVDGPPVVDGGFNFYPQYEAPSLTASQISEILGNDTSISFPQTIFAAQALSKNQIANRSNYEALLNLLHQQTAEVESDISIPKPIRISSQKESYDMIMAEIVRQGFIECTAKGELLQNVRGYMNDSVSLVDKLHERMGIQKEAAQKAINDLVSRNENIQKDISRLISDNNSLSKRDSELVARISFLEQRLPMIEDESRQIRNQLQKAERSLMETTSALNEAIQKSNDSIQELHIKEGIVDELSNKLMDSSESIVQLKMNCSQLAIERDSLINQIDDLRKALEKSFNNEKLLKNEISQLTQKSGVSKEYQDIKIQANLITKTKSVYGRMNSELQGSSSSIPKTPKMADNQQIYNEFSKLKEEYIAAKTILGEEATPISLDSWSKLRELVLSRSKNATLTTKSFLESQKGTMILDQSQGESIRVFSNYIISRIMDRCTRSVSRTSNVTQTYDTSQKIIKESIGILADPSNQSDSGLFVQMLDPTYKDRPPRPFEWIIRSCRGIFDEKTTKDISDINEGREPLSMQDFVIQWATRQFGLSFLAQQCAWDLVNSSRFHQNKAQEINMFRMFLDGVYCLDQLTFFLRIRQICIRRGISIQNKAKDSEEQYNEVFLTSYQGEEIIKSTLRQAGEEEVEFALRKIKDDIIKKVSQNLDASLSYVPMTSVCRQCIECYERHSKTELRRILGSIKINPSVSEKHMESVIISILPILSHQETKELYQQLFIQKRDRKKITVDELGEIFKMRSLLSKDHSVDGFQSEAPEGFESTLSQWRLLRTQYTAIINSIQKSEINPIATHAALILQQEMEKVHSAIACFDVIGMQKLIVSSLFAYKNLVWSLNPPSISEVDQMLNNLKDIIIK